MLADEPDPTTAQRFATRIEGEVSRLGRSVDDLLELTQIEFGLPAGSAAVSLDEVADEVIARTASVADDRQISVDGPTAPSGFSCGGDRRQLSSALYNLVDNAVKYSSAGGTVQIAWRYQAPGMASVEVVDSGIGIPGADLERVFDRFIGWIVPGGATPAAPDSAWRSFATSRKITAAPYGCRPPRASAPLSRCSCRGTLRTNHEHDNHFGGGGRGVVR